MGPQLSECLLAKDHYGAPYLSFGVQDPESSLVSSLHPHCWQLCHSSGLEGTQENHSLGKYLLSTECVGGSGVRIQQAEPARPSPLILPGPAPPPDTTSHITPHWRPFSSVEKNSRKIQNCREKAGLGGSGHGSQGLSCPPQDTHTPILSSRGFRSVNPGLSAHLSVSLPSCPLSPLHHSPPWGLPELL